MKAEISESLHQYMKLVEQQEERWKDQIAECNQILSHADTGNSNFSLMQFFFQLEISKSDSDNAKGRNFNTQCTYLFRINHVPSEHKLNLRIFCFFSPDHSKIHQTRKRRTQRQLES